MLRDVAVLLRLGMDSSPFLLYYAVFKRYKNIVISTDLFLLLYFKIGASLW